MNVGDVSPCFVCLFFNLVLLLLLFFSSTKPLEMPRKKCEIANPVTELMSSLKV